jgi:hypothetical protein
MGVLPSCLPKSGARRCACTLGRAVQIPPPTPSRSGAFPAPGTTLGDTGREDKDEDPNNPQKHHIATDKNWKSEARGGPWSPVFFVIFSRGGITLQHPKNIVEVPGHKGPHPQRYHEIVFDRLTKATEGLEPGSEAYRQALLRALDELGAEAQTPGTELHDLLVNGDPVICA